MITLKGLKKLISNPIVFIQDYRSKNKSNKNLNVSHVNIITPIRIILHTGEGKQAQSHLNLWVEYFINSEVDFLVLTRNKIAYDNACKDYPFGVHIAYAKAEPDVVELVNSLPMLRACFYPSNTGNNIHLLNFTHLEHIFIGHGDSDKTASVHKFFRAYDQNWVAGNAHKDRFKNSGFEFSGLKFVNIGRPNLLKVLTKTQDNWIERFSGNIKLLYLPTWEGVYEEQNYSSLSIIREIIEKLNNKKPSLFISIKLHPSTGNRLSPLKDLDKTLLSIIKAKELNCEIVDRKVQINKLLTERNIFICDISAVVSECLSANGPIFVYIPTDRDIKISQSDMSYDYYTYTFSSSEELIEKIEQVLYIDDYLAINRKLAMEYILGSKETLDNRFIKNLKQINNLEYKDIL